ncbi:MAG: hypothetical protein ACR2N4_14850 [Jatrophihabitans sp.]
MPARSEVAVVASSARDCRVGPGQPDPAALRRWAAESRLIELAQAERRAVLRARIRWLAVVAFLLADIAVALWLILVAT